MKIISYNVNGIRAAIKKGLLEWLQHANPDVFCIQETKALKEQVDIEAIKRAGYTYNYWFSAEKKGYSGVAIFCKTQPDHIEYGTGIPSMDNEGRNLRVDFGEVSIMSLYLPSGTNSKRLGFKFKYMDMFLDYVTELRQKRPNLIICGDYNICHEAIDIHDPVRNKTVSGFLPEERAWLSKFINSGFIDTFRYFHPEKKHQYTWWSYRANARANNKGWRIDYAMASKPLENKLKQSGIFTNAIHSDHCPLFLKLT